MDLILNLGDESLDDEDLRALTVELQRSIKTDAHASVVTKAPEPGSRGDPVTLGALALALISSGAVTSLISVPAAFAARRSSLEFEVTAENGEVLKLTAENLRGPQVDESIKIVKDFIGRSA